MKRNCWLIYSLIMSFVSGCMAPPLAPSHSQNASSFFEQTSDSEFRTQALTITEPTAPQWESVNQLPSQPEFELQFQTKQQSKHKIQIPETGEFKLLIEAGSDYKILDRNALDGMAHITVPAQHVHDLYLKIKKPFEEAECQGKMKNTPECLPDAPSALLEVDDHLYMTQQTLSPSSGSHWYYIPHRPLPIPADWYSSDQQKYILRFKNKGIKGFVSRWFQSNAQAQIPLSVMVKPKLDCVQENLNGTYTAYLGYQNEMPGTVSLPISEANEFFPAPADRRQLTLFSAGSSPSYPDSPLAISFKESSLTWSLNHRSITIPAADESLRCPQNGVVTEPTIAVRKTFISPQNFTISTGTQANFVIPFMLNEAADIKRRLLVNLLNTNQAIERAEVLINGNSLNPYLDDQSLLNTSVPGMVAQSFGSLHTGQNYLELKLQGPTGSSVSLSLDGFLMPIDIPHALHSRLERLPIEKGVPYEKGRLRVKFIEGLQIRLSQNPDLSKQLEFSRKRLSVPQIV